METNALITEKLLVKKRFSKALTSYNENAVVQQHIHCRLIDLLKETGRTSFDRIIEIGCGTGGFTHKITSHCVAGEWIINDLCDVCLTKVSDCFSNQNWKYMPGDAEQLAFTGKIDMLASASVIQWFDNPAQFIRKMSAQFNNEGILLLNTFGEKNLLEIKSLTGKGLQYPSITEVRNWVNSSFEILYLEEEEIKLRFTTPLEVLNHLKYTGVTGTNKSAWTRSMLQNFCEEYLKRYSVNKYVTLTYHPIYLLAVKK